MPEPRLLSRMTATLLLSRSLPITWFPIQMHSPKSAAMLSTRLRIIASSLLASAHLDRRLSTATFALALLSVPISLPSRSSLKSRTHGQPSVMFLRATCGIPATSYSEQAFCSKNIDDFEPDSSAAIATAVENAGKDLGFVTLDPAAFACASAKSIDYAVMERTSRAAVTPVSYGWSDVGSWQAVWELSGRDADGNAARGSAVFDNSRGSYVASERQLVALSGLDNVVVVATDDAILVGRREDSEGLRRVVEKLKQIAPTLTKDHLKVHRPWGSYQSVDIGDRFQVKRIVVKQGGRLSLQLHLHRAEHWIVVRGTARVTIGDEVKLLHENELIYVPSSVRHRLENPGKIDLELIEVQTGSYLGEDDIVRLEDDYHRS